VRIGQEDVPWFCSEHNIYIAFEFANFGHERDTIGVEASDSDTLKQISIFPWLEGCL